MLDIIRQTKVLEKSFSSTDINYSKPLAVVGCGGVGSILAQLLVRGGFTNISLYDYDVVDETNLQRQYYFQEDIGKPKVEALKNHLLSINSSCYISIYAESFSQNRSETFDFVFDATDSLESRKEIHEFAKSHSIPWIYAGAIESKSIVYLFDKACDLKYSKLFPPHAKNQGCELGVLASSTTIAASLSYSQFLAYLCGEYENKGIRFDCLKNEFISFTL